MNRPEPPSFAIPDVQSAADGRELPIDRVGIKGLRYPIRFADGDAEAQPTIANCNVYVALPHDRKGTHMSRLLAIVDEMRAPLSLSTLPALLGELTSRLRRARRTDRIRVSAVRAQEGSGIRRIEPDRL